MDQFLSTETLIIELMLVVTVVAIVVRWLRIPYTVALVLVGLFLSIQSPVQVNLTPDLILALFVPPLVFEAAFHINFRDLRTNLAAILVFAVPGVILTTFIIGGILYWGTAISFASALVFGALISATDPVSVVALFRTLGVPKRLSLIVEGESLFNDGTAIVMFNLVLMIALTGKFNLVDSISEFFKVAFGGILLGLFLGWLVSRLIARIDDYLIETTVTTILAFGSYLIAERLGFSGVLAVVAAGLVNGNLGPQGMSPTTRIVLTNFWEYVAFIANSLIFLLLGLEINIPRMLASWQPILWAIVAVFIARPVVIYGLGFLVNRFSNPIPRRWLHIINWGGLRGAVGLALVLSLPVQFADSGLFRVMAFGVVLFTLLVQGPSMRPIIRKLGLITRSDSQIEYEKKHALVVAARAGYNHLRRRHNEGLLSTSAWERIEPRYQEIIRENTEKLHEVLVVSPEVEADVLEVARREALRAERSAMYSLLVDGVISQEVYDELSVEIDLKLDNNDASRDSEEGSTDLPQDIEPDV